MRSRDRLVLAALAAIALVGAMWLIVVSPERKQGATLDTQIAAEQVALSQAQAQLATARQAVAAYVGNVHQVDAVMRAVPQDSAEADVIRTIVKLAGTKVDFQSIGVGGAGDSGVGPFSLGLSFNFAANYGNLQSFISALDALTTTDGTHVSADGRLFTIQTVSLQPSSGNSTKASVVATVYQQNTAETAATSATGATGVTGAVGVPTS